MAQASKGTRLKLGEPWASELADFCAAHYGAPEVGIIREALRQFMDARLAAEPEMRKRYELARKERLAGKSANLRLLKNGD